MKKIQSIDEAGRSMAKQRYGSVANQSAHGHSQMGQNLRKKFQFADGGGVSDEDIKAAEDMTTQRRAREDAEIKEAQKPQPQSGSFSAGSSFLTPNAPGAIRKLFGGYKRGGKVK